MAPKKEASFYRLGIVIAVILTVSAAVLIYLAGSDEAKVKNIKASLGEPDCMFITDNYTRDALKMHDWLPYMVCNAWKKQDYEACYDIPEELDRLAFTHCDFRRILKDNQKRCVSGYIINKLASTRDPDVCKEIKEKDYPDIRQLCDERAKLILKLKEEGFSEASINSMCETHEKNPSDREGCIASMTHECSRYGNESKYRAICEITSQDPSSADCRRYIIP